MLTYVVLAAIASLGNLFVYLTIDRGIKSAGYFDPAFFGGIVNLLEVFGWIEHGAIVAFFQQFAALLLLAVFVHTLVAMQDRWYGWTVVCCW